MSGLFGVEKQRCARAAYEGLMQFVQHQLQSVHPRLRHLRHVHFVNIDKETTDAMANVFKSLYEKFMLPSQVSTGETLPTGCFVDASTNTDGGVLESVKDDPQRSEPAVASKVHPPSRRLKDFRSAPSAATESDEDAAGAQKSADGDVKAGSSGNGQSSSDGKPKTDSTPSGQDAEVTRGAENGAVQRNDKVSADAGASITAADRTEQMSYVVCRCTKPKHVDACGHPMCPDCRKKASSDRSCCEVCVMEGKDAEKLSNVNGIAEDTTTVAATTAAADDDDEGNKVDGEGSKKVETSSKRPRSRVLKKDDCVICLEPMSEPKQLDCGHKFCAHCIDEYFQKGQPKCPSCGKLFGMLKGNQPPGSLTSKCIPHHLAGYEHHGAIELTYCFANGVQTVSDITMA